MPKIITEAAQNLTDIAVMTGGVERIFELVAQNEALQSITSTLQPGMEIGFEKPMIAEKGQQDLYDFFANRKIRVKTGDIPASNMPYCGIPEDYVLAQFTIQDIQPHTVLYFHRGSSCPLWAEIDRLQLNSQIALINYFYGSNTISPQGAAQRFCQWFNATSRWNGFAVCSSATVYLYLPAAEWACGEAFSLCLFEQTAPYKDRDATLFPREYIPPFADGGDATIFFPNGQYTNCCGQYVQNSFVPDYPATL